MNGFLKSLLLSLSFTLFAFASPQINLHNLKYNYIDRIDAGVAGELILSKDNTKAFVTGYGSGLFIIDISDHKDMKLLSNYTYSSEFSGLSAWGVAISNDEKIAFIGNSDSRLDIVDINDSTEPKLISKVDLNNSAYPRSVTVNKDNTIAYVPSGYTGGLQVVDISDINNPQLTAHYPADGDAQHITLSKDETIGYLSSNTAGVLIFDLNDSSNPKLLHTIDLETLSYWCELSPDGNTLFAGGSNGLDIIDVSDPTNPNILSTIQTPDPVRIEGLSLLPDMSKAYLAASSSGVMEVDITTLTNPQITQTYNLRQAEGIKIADNGTIAFVGDNKDGLIAIDITTPNLNKTISTYSFEHNLYTRKIVLSDDETKAYTIANNDSGIPGVLTLLDISQPESISTLNSFSQLSSLMDFEIFDNGSKMMIADGFGANDSEGIKILNISDPNNITTISMFNDTQGYIQGVEISNDNNTLFTNERFKGIGIYDINDINSPTLLSSSYDINNTSGYAWQNLKNYLTWVNDMKLSKDETKLFIADENTGLTILNITNKSQPVIEGTYYKETKSNTIEVDEDKNLVYIGTENGTVDIYDISDTSQPQLLATLSNFDYTITNIKSSKYSDIIYILENTKTVTFVDISSPSTPQIIGNTEISSFNYDLTLSNDEKTAFISNGYDGIKVIDITPNLYIADNETFDLSFKLKSEEQNNIALSINLEDSSLVNIGSYQSQYSSQEYNDSILVTLAPVTTGTTPLKLTINDGNSSFETSVYLHITPSDLDLYNIKKGWNLVSGDINVGAIPEIFRILWKYNNSKWQAYSDDTTIKTSIENSADIDLITQINFDEGVWILSDQAYNFTYENDQNTSSFEYPKGWNLAGTNNNINISQISCLDSNISSLWKYKKHTWMLNTQIQNNLNLESFDTIDANEGFWVNCK